MIEMLHCDCTEYMAGLPDKAFDLAIVDPPYGIGTKKMQLSWGEGKKVNGWKKKFKDYKEATWDTKPSKKYFTELFRVSRNQIIWGYNYFELPLPKGVVFWDKKTGGFSTGDGELAWSSFNHAIVKYEYMWKGMLKGPNGNHRENRFHPTQKPVALYKWLLSRYAKPGDKILDTHGGSGSICIACHDLGYDLTWMELDADYYKAACERYQNHAAQGFLFSPSTPLTPVAESPTLFGE